MISSLKTLDELLDLLARLAGMLRDDRVPPFPEALRLFLEHLDDEVVLRFEHSIERDLRRARFGGDGVDAHGANAVSIEEVDRGAEQPVARARIRIALRQRRERR